MSWSKSHRLGRILPVSLVAGLVMVGAGPLGSVRGVAQAPPAQSASGADAQIQSDLTHALRDKRLRGVTEQVANGVVVLNGSVQNLEDKIEAEKKAEKVRNVVSVQNHIEVEGPTVSDEELRNKLLTKLFYDREGYWEHPFNAITANVQNGVVTMGGLVVLPVDKESAEGVVSEYPGVKGMIDNIQVAPLSPNDNRIRQNVAAAIYNYPVFTRYKIDPGNPIRIIVLNGNVTLVGTVNNEGDKEQANIRANGVPGVFKVTNDLQVAGPNEK
jgi:hyperosmotically inducible protein